MKERMGQKVIMIVDDEDKVRESVREVLADEGYRVVDTADGTHVLELIEQGKARTGCCWIFGCPRSTASICLSRLRARNRRSTW